MQKKNISDLRQDYTKGILQRNQLNPNPFLQFEEWFFDAVNSGHPEPSAMQLATVGSNGEPHSRIVLLKGIEDEQMVFYTNYDSAKAREINRNPNVAALLFWPLLERQIRIEGTVCKTSAVTSDNYFASRPRESQIGAWASPQSREIESQEYLQNLFSDAEKQFAGQPVTRPPNWGGYAIKPVLFEFWQGQTGRMHHRFQYKLDNNHWRIVQLAP